MGLLDLVVIAWSNLPSVAIVTAGSWAIWTWVMQERLRRHLDFPALDGELAVSLDAPSAGGRAIVTIRALWRNRGRLPVYLDPNRTTIQIYRIERDIASGTFDLRSRGVTMICESFPIHGFEWYVLEPLTDSTIQQCAVLPDVGTFLIRSAICVSAGQKAYPDLREPMWCVRQLVWEGSAYRRAPVT